MEKQTEKKNSFPEYDQRSRMTCARLIQQGVIADGNRFRFCSVLVIFAESVGQSGEHFTIKTALSNELIFIPKCFLKIEGFSVTKYSTPYVFVLAIKYFCARSVRHKRDKKHWKKKSIQNFKKKRKNKQRKFDSEKQKELKVLDKGSWYDQDKLLREQGIRGNFEKEKKASASQSKIGSYEFSSSDEEEKSESEIEVMDDEQFSKAVHHWIISIEALENYLSDVAVCKMCHDKLEVREEKSYRAGLGTVVSETAYIQTVIYLYM
ncbi:uncharacterized protein LOC130653857 [Hydractinia symbiolongicarpus]|uniref:uncharacterized protein LOC130653857 n=1 Tax=Hydractinia symbiolongicarpus TaxID=13093 RepID=UPI00254A2689|nr:uncharacterized protein LOC130653857 [Hydractinia symbiolongicarpus]